MSLAFVHAIAGRVGVNVSHRYHDYGVDVTLHPVIERGHRLVESGFPIDLQLKATTAWRREGDEIVYELEAKTYNDIVARDPAAVPLYLALLCLDSSDETWLTISEEDTILRRCCYWHKPSGSATSNARTIVVRIPRSNLLTVHSVEHLLEEARRTSLGRSDAS